MDLTNSASGSRPGHAETLLGTYSLLLSSARLMLTARVLRAQCQRNGRTERVDSGIAQMSERIESLAQMRDSWALRCEPSEPQFWITAYARLAAMSASLEQEMTDAAAGAEPEVRSEILQSDLPVLRQAAMSYREMLRSHQVRSIVTGEAGLPPTTPEQ